MPFFFVLPLWLFAVAVSVLMICIPRTRRLGVYLLMMSTCATVASFVLAYAVLIVGLWLAAATNADWLRLIALGGYLIAIPVGGVLGAIASVLCTNALFARYRVRR